MIQDSILKSWHPAKTASDTVSLPYRYICQNLVVVVVKIILYLTLEEKRIGYDNISLYKRTINQLVKLSINLSIPVD